MKHRGSGLWLVAALAVVALALAPGAHVTQASASGVVISAVYGGGGNAGADFQNDYIELFNAGSAAVDISNWSLQYTSSTGNTWNNLTEIPATTTLQVGQYYLVQGSGSTANGIPLPTTPDLTDASPINLAGASGKIALFNTTTQFVGGTDPQVSPNYVDFVGYGAANPYEGSGAAPTLSNGTHGVRANNGCQDTDDNSADFAAVDVFTPRNTSSTLNPCLAPDLVTDVSGASNGVTGSPVTYTATVTNQGTAQADNVVMTVDLSGTAFAGATVDNFSEPQAFCSYLSPTITCNIGTLAASGGSYAVMFDVTPAVDGTLTIDSDATSNPADAGPNTDQLTTTFSPPAGDLTVNIIESDDPILSTDTLTLSFEISNVGTANATNYTLSASLSGGIGTFVTAPSGCSLSNGDTTLDCSFAGPLANDSDPNYVDANVVFSGAGTLTTDAAVQVAGDPNTGNDTDSETTTVDQGCGVAWDSIHDYQEGGVNEAVRGVVITTEGVVTADFQPSSPNGIGGFFVQEKFPDGDDTTSEGIFVFNNSFPVNAGDYIRITGTISEFDPSGSTPGGTLTQLSSITKVTLCAVGNTIAPTEVELPIADLADWENYESMLVEIVGSSGSLTVADMFALGSFGEMIVSDGKLYQPTHLYYPNTPDVANHLDLVARARIVVDDQRNGTGPNPVPHFPVDPNGLIRMGDETDSITGVILYTELSSTPMFRLHYTVPPVFAEVNPRPTSVPAVGTTTLKVASFNVLNYFNGNGAGGGFTTSDQRGAGNLTEFVRQTDKLVSAINKLDADVIGLMEIENDGEIPLENQAIFDLIAALNTAAGAGTWSFIDTGPIGTDDIRVALIYKTATATPVGPFAVLDYSEPFISFSRPPLAQTFEDINGGKVTVVVNHFKSKGCGGASGDDLDQGDGQGCFNATRVLSSTLLNDWINTGPTGTNDPDYLVIGDLNSYAKEDPITLLLAFGGYTDLLADAYGEDAYGYYFSGQAGYLDYALANDELNAQVTGVDVWHINSDEATIFDYNDFANTAPYYAVNEFRTSDHDPVLVGLNLVGTTAEIDSDDFILAGDDVTVTVQDLDVDAASVQITVTSTEGESETLTLFATGTPGEFSDTFNVADAAPTASNSILEGVSGTLTFSYIDGLNALGQIDTVVQSDTIVYQPGNDAVLVVPVEIVPGEDDWTINVTDADLTGPTVDVTVTSASGDSEIVTLTDVAGTYTAAVETVFVLGTPVASNSTIEVQATDTLTVTYNDVNTVAGPPAQRTENIAVNFDWVPEAFTLVETPPTLREASFDLSWTEPDGSSVFRIVVTQISTNTRLGTFVDEIVEADDVCAAGTCTYNVTGSPAGLFSWTVVAFGTSDVEASNAPGFYTVILDAIELISNGGFELDTNDDGTPDGWTGKNLSGDKRKCGAKGDGSDCALQFKGGVGPAGQFKQDLADATLILGTDVLDISAAASVNRDNTGVFVTVKVKYANPTAGANADGKDKVKLALTGVAPVGYSTIAGTLTADDAVTSASVKVAYKLTSGKLFVDDVSVVLQPIAPRTRLSDGAALDILPVPAVPDGFRGNN
ncbi:MAG: ExeM/NucH family extracellular endonuclease [Chloroflexi bacterium]|nr:ExeM/NucH family extracellular endonuclease [Chloroflexota bacterium]